MKCRPFLILSVALLASAGALCQELPDTEANREHGCGGGCTQTSSGTYRSSSNHGSDRRDHDWDRNDSDWHNDRSNTRDDHYVPEIRQRSAPPAPSTLQPSPAEVLRRQQLQEAHNLNSDANRLFASGGFDVALPLYKRAAALAPQNRVIFKNLVHCEAKLAEMRHDAMLTAAYGQIIDDARIRRAATPPVPSPELSQLLARNARNDSDDVWSSDKETAFLFARGIMLSYLPKADVIGTIQDAPGFTKLYGEYVLELCEDAMNSLHAVISGNYGLAQMYQQRMEERSQNFQLSVEQYVKQDAKNHIAEGAGAMTSRNLLDKALGH